VKPPPAAFPEYDTELWDAGTYEWLSPTPIRPNTSELTAPVRERQQNEEEISRNSDPRNPRRGEESF